MKLYEYNNRFILENDQGLILIITREKRIALKIAETMKDGTSNG